MGKPMDDLGPTHFLRQAYDNGVRFYGESPGESFTAPSRSCADRYRKEMGGNVTLYYILPDGGLRICARGKRLK